MKRSILGMVVAVILFACVSVCTGTDFSGEYENNQSLVTLTQKGDSIQFSINSSVGQNVCNVEGVATILDKKRAAYTNQTDPDDKCVILFDFDPGVKGIALRVITKECDSYCGLNAAGSMDGLYIKRRSKPKGTRNGKSDHVNFFDNQNISMKIIDGSLHEGMLTGHYGCVEKAIHSLQAGLEYKEGSQERTVMDKIAWYNIVNAHRMLDSIYKEVSSNKNQQIYNNLEELDRIISTIGKKSFQWDENQSLKMYGLTRELIEARISDLAKGCFGKGNDK